jgi:chemotaxis protein MotB
MAEEKEEKRPIIIKKIRKVHGGRQGVNWKPAPIHYFAAMIPFFLLAWLLAMASPPAKQAVVDYFQGRPQVSVSGADAQQ